MSTQPESELTAKARALIAAYLDELAGDIESRRIYDGHYATQTWLAIDLREQADGLRMDYDGDDVDRARRAVARLLSEVQSK